MLAIIMGKLDSAHRKARNNRTHQFGEKSRFRKSGKQANILQKTLQECDLVAPPTKLMYAEEALSGCATFIALLSPIDETLPALKRYDQV